MISMYDMAPHVRKMFEAREEAVRKQIDAAMNEQEHFYEMHPELPRPKYLDHRYDPDYWLPERTMKDYAKIFLKWGVIFLAGVLVSFFVK